MRDGTRLPDLILEQFALGELPEAERSRVQAAIEEDPSLRERLEEIRRSDEAILADYPPAEAAADIRRRALEPVPPRGLRGRRSFMPVFMASAAALGLVFIGAFAFRGILFPSKDDMTRPKGGTASLSVYRKTQVGVEELRERASARAGDLLQLRYGAGSASYGAVFSIDGRGELTFHLPAGYRGEAAAAPELDPKGAALSSAYELDDAPAFERFYFVSSAEPFDMAQLWGAATELAGKKSETGEPRLGSGLSFSTLTILKEGGPK